MSRLITIRPNQLTNCIRYQIHTTEMVLVNNIIEHIKFLLDLHKTRKSRYNKFNLYSTFLATVGGNKGISIWSCPRPTYLSSSLMTSLPDCLWRKRAWHQDTSGTSVYTRLQWFCREVQPWARSGIHGTWRCSENKTEVKTKELKYFGRLGGGLMAGGYGWGCIRCQHQFVM